MNDLKRTARFRTCRLPASAWLPVPAGIKGMLLAAAGVLFVVSGAVPAQSRPTPDTFEATTTGMSPEGITLRINVLEWPDAAARADVVAVLGAAENVASGLADLPSLGVVWRSGSGVGHSLKYAHRETTDDGHQRVTVVTDKPIDSYSFAPWTVPGSDTSAELGYTVIELLLDANGSGTGTLSLAAEVELDAEAGEVRLAGSADVPRVLGDARELPRPYYVRD